MVPSVPFLNPTGIDNPEEAGVETEVGIHNYYYVVIDGSYHYTDIDLTYSSYEPLLANNQAVVFHPPS